jgi:hypothetical protein
MAMLLTLIEGAAVHVSPHRTVREQAAELIRWAESSTGRGLEAIQKALIGFMPSVRGSRRPELVPGDAPPHPPFGYLLPGGEEGTASAPAEGDDRRRAHRDCIRDALEEKLLALGRGEGPSPRMLDCIATALEIRNPPREEDRLRETIAGHLLDVKDDQAIPRLNKLYIELWNGGKEVPADLVADCMDLIFPLYFSWEAIEEAARQLERRKVLVERAVSSMPGADFVLAVHDGASTCFVSDADGPRGKHAIRMEAPPIDEPSLEYDVCQILDHVLRQLSNTPDPRGTDGTRVDEATRIRRLSADLNGVLSYYKTQHRRSLYGVVQKQGSEEDRGYVLKVLERLRGLVPQLILIELDPDALARQSEGALGYLLRLRFQESRKRSTP